MNYSSETATRDWPAARKTADHEVALELRHSYFLLSLLFAVPKSSACALE